MKSILFDDHIDELQSILHGLSRDLEAQVDKSEVFNLLANSSTEIRSKLSSAGGNIYNKINHLDQIKSLAWYFDWLSLSKHFFVEYRNIVLNLQKAKVKLASDHVSKQKYHDFLGKKIKYFQKISTDFVRLSKEMSKKSITQKQLDSVLLLENPYPVYKKQYEEIESQILNIAKDDHNLFRLLQGYKDLKASISSQLDGNKSVIKSNLDAIINLRDEILHDKEDQDIPKIIKSIEAKENPNNKVYLGLEQNGIIEGQTKALKISVDTKDGQVVYKNINAKEQLQNWKDIEISPITYELIELTENNIYQFDMTLLNLKNQLMVMRNNEDVKLTNGRLTIVLNTLNRFIEKSEEELDQIKNYKQTTLHSLEKDLDLANIYDSELLLFRSDTKTEIPSSASPINDMVLYARSIFQKHIKPAGEDFFKAGINKDVGKKTHLMQVVAQRNEEMNNSYSNIFLTKSYTGESFWINRHQMEDVGQIVELWKSGFGGSVLISGNRQCGKTVFLHMVGKKHFANKFLTIVPDTVLEIEGRTFEVGYNLNQVFEFIDRNALSAKYLICIDDLELWSHKDYSLSKNIQFLLHWIGKLSKKHFFAVTLGNFTLERFNDHLHIRESFQGVVDISKMEKEEMYKAIAIRHGATHSKLYDGNLAEINEYAFKQMISNLYGFFKGNIGDALQLWSIQNRPHLENKIVNRKIKLLHLPQFINGNNILIIRTLLVYKKIGEYQLRKLFGPSFKGKYKHQLDKLLNLGVVKRLPDHKIEVSAYCANEIARMVEEVD